METTLTILKRDNEQLTFKNVRFYMDEAARTFSIYSLDQQHTLVASFPYDQLVGYSYREKARFIQP